MEIAPSVSRFFPDWLFVPDAARLRRLESYQNKPRLVDLQGKVGPLLIDNGMFGIGEVLRTKVSDYLITDELHGHPIPFAWLEVIKHSPWRMENQGPLLSCAV